MWTIFKVFIEFITISLVLHFVFLTVKHVGSWLPDQGLNLCHLHWKCGILKSGPPGKSLNYISIK